MAGEKTEKATPKRRKEANKKGQYGKSQDLNSAIMLGVGMTLLYIYVPMLLHNLESMAAHTFSNLNPENITPEQLTGLLAPYFQILTIILPFLLILAATGIIVVRVQAGNIFSMEHIKPKLDKLSPMTIMNGLKDTFNLFKPKKAVELLKSVIKATIIGAFAYSVIMSRKHELLTLLGADITLAFSTITSIMTQIIINTCIVMFVIGFIDKKFQEYEFEKSIKMSKQDVKDERKNADGDPIIKSKIRSIQYKFAQQRMMGKIPTANVVVTNPTHYAVALRYDTSIAPAPQVVAKGVDFVAFKIREIAENNNIPIVENKPLARTLYKIVPLDGLIPSELYVAVAEVLAFVYKQNKNNKKR